MKHILLIGGAGYIGSVITNHLLYSGQKVTVLDNLIFNNKFAIKDYFENQNFKFIKGDLRNKKDLDRSISDITDIILLASVVGDPISKKYPKETNEINNIGIKKCLDYFNKKKIEKVFFVSTCSNYGLDNSNELIDEKHKLNPLSLYAKTKVSVEKYILENKNNFDFTPVILRFATAFGASPRMRFDLTVNQFANELAQLNTLEVYDPDTWRPYCHVQDFAKIIFKLLFLENKIVKNEIFNIGSNKNNFTKRQIVEMIVKKIGKKCDVKIIGEGPDKRNYKINFNKITNLINHDMISVSAGIDEILSEIKNKKYSDYANNRDKYENLKISG